MSLVAYESSDGSDEEGEDEVLASSQSDPKVTIGRSDHKPTKERSDEAGKPTIKSGLFSSLPAPKRVTTEPSLLVVEAPVPRGSNRKEPVRIMIPSLKEFKDEEEEEEKSKLKRKPSTVSSGLIGLLPEPQNLNLKESAKNLIPLSVSRKATVSAPLKTTSKRSLPESSTNSSQVVPRVSSPDSHPKSHQEHGSDDETLTDFFSLSGNPESEVSSAPLKENTALFLPGDHMDGTTEVKPIACERASAVGNEYSHVPCVAYAPGDKSYSVNSSASASSHFDTLNTQYYGYECTDSQQQYQNHEWNNGPSVESEQPTLKGEAFVRLAGKKRSNQESIEIVDVNGDDLVAGRDEWLLKSLSETDSYQPAPKRSDQPSAMHRRKHQITYLAFQAKAREQELKNQWSMNRMTKKQTQSKYGF